MPKINRNNNNNSPPPLLNHRVYTSRTLTSCMDGGVSSSLDPNRTRRRSVLWKYYYAPEPRPIIERQANSLVDLTTTYNPSSTSFVKSKILKRYSSSRVSPTARFVNAGEYRHTNIEGRGVCKTLRTTTAGQPVAPPHKVFPRRSPDLSVRNNRTYHYVHPQQQYMTNNNTNNNPLPPAARVYGGGGGYDQQPLIGVMSHSSLSRHHSGMLNSSVSSSLATSVICSERPACVLSPADAFGTGSVVSELTRDSHCPGSMIVRRMSSSFHHHGLNNHVHDAFPRKRQVSRTGHGGHDGDLMQTTTIQRVTSHKNSADNDSDDLGNLDDDPFEDTVTPTSSPSNRVRPFSPTAGDHKVAPELARSHTVHFDLQRLPSGNEGSNSHYRGPLGYHRHSRSVPAHLRKCQFKEEGLSPVKARDTEILKGIRKMTDDYDLNERGGSLVDLQQKELSCLEDPKMADGLEQELSRLVHREISSGGKQASLSRLSPNVVVRRRNKRDQHQSMEPYGCMSISSTVSTTASSSSSLISDARSTFDSMMAEVENVFCSSRELSEAFSEVLMECMAKKGGPPSSLCAGNGVLNSETRASVVAWIAKVVEAMRWPLTTFFISVHALDKILSNPKAVVALGVDEPSVPLLCTACVLVGVSSECEHREVQKMKHFVGQVPNVMSVREILSKQIAVTVYLTSGTLVNKTPIDFIYYYIANVRYHEAALAHSAMSCGFTNHPPHKTLFERLMTCRFVPHKQLQNVNKVVLWLKEATDRYQKGGLSTTAAARKPPPPEVDVAEFMNRKYLILHETSTLVTSASSAKTHLIEYLLAGPPPRQGQPDKSSSRTKSSNSLASSGSEALTTLVKPSSSVPFAEVLIELAVNCCVFSFNRGLYTAMPNSRIVAAMFIGLCSLWIDEFSDFEFLSDFSIRVCCLDYESQVLPLIHKLPKFAALCLYSVLISDSMTTGGAPQQGPPPPGSRSGAINPSSSSTSSSSSCATPINSTSATATHVSKCATLSLASLAVLDLLVSFKPISTMDGGGEISPYSTTRTTTSSSHSRRSSNDERV